ncbi:Candidapepsin-8 [Lachnellula cervina]|uniref:Candidapepsin-8 n=1 Tax=Lachnellula cervina TaxID=1316786 RepID=A0A7D8YMB1_9HELO|nr:Candidapepsin-8 [Lachnellula cervina]
MPSFFHGKKCHSFLSPLLIIVSVCDTTDASIFGLPTWLHTRAVPSPIVVTASQDWDGNDGPWSSFPIQVGTPSQDVKVLISTAGTQTWVVAPEGCTNTDPSNCATLRGGEYLLNQSSTYVPNLTNTSSNIYNLSFESSLGDAGFGRYGFDDITMGWQGSGGPMLKNQTFAGIATKSFYLGIFGLTPRPSNFTEFDDPIPSYMENLRNQSLIASSSWAYTAGNQYRFDKVLGSLTLGGYDASKFIPNSLTWPFNQEDARDLTVSIDSITMTNSSATKALLPTAISAFIDSTVSQIWLPQEACTLFEKAFNLTWNSDAQLYLVSDSQHQNLLTENANVTFTLSNFKDKVNVTLPYSAFDLVAQYPLVSNDTRYFPLKRANISSQYTLGRTFLQEAYVITDYDRQNFSVSQCDWTPNAPQNIKTILPPSKSVSNGSSNSTNSTASVKPQKSHGLGAGAIAGVAIAAVLVLIGAALLLVYFTVLKPRRAEKAKAKAEAEAEAAIEEEAPPAFTSTEASPDDADTIMETELNGQGLTELGDHDVKVRAHETDGTEKYEMYSPEKMAAEMEAKVSGQIFEMPALEEVASELMGAGSSAELENNERKKRVELQDTPWSPQEDKKEDKKEDKQEDNKEDNKEDHKEDRMF